MRGQTFFTTLAAIVILLSSQTVTVIGLPVAGQVEDYAARDTNRRDNVCWLKRELC
ncbi:hypothetical protein FA95DRAFT_1566245 [Auriscalpium vulgare]|uniref:Uncharacterized protein n=1 Tax=Auriscalpium vulgare TaxID=40419 RepID=A0ACB8R956_9AGAM|nr:hypothetical protein FA95DRAFT_1566245 [Auriscalpium vulgare]